MNEQAIRVALDRHCAASEASDNETAHEIYRDDVLPTYPQSDERIHGRRNVQASRARRGTSPIRTQKSADPFPPATIRFRWVEKA